MSAARRENGGSPGVLSTTVQWDEEETRGWLVLQFSGLAALWVARCFIVVSIVPMAQELGWDERQCGIVLSAFYWGYLLTQVIGGNLSDRFGGDVVQWIAGVVWSVATLSSIYLAQTSIWPLVLARFLTGLAQGMHYPAISSLVASKVPEHAKTKFYGIAHSGAFVGAMGVGFLGSLIIKWYHWKALVLIVGFFTLSWTICLRLFSVAHHKKTQYRLLDGQPTSPTSRLKLNLQPSSFMASCRKIPWKKLLSQSSVIAYFVGVTTECSYAHIMPSWSPTFFSEVFPNRSDSAWLYNGAPSLVTAIGAYSGGLIINHLILQKYEVTLVRKIGSCICLFLPGVCLAMISVIGRGDDNYPFTLFLLLLSSYFFGYAPAAISVNCMDLTPNYAGSVYGVGNTLGALPGVFAVPLIGYILQSTGSWALVFLFQTTILFAGWLVFLAYGSASRVDLGSTPTD